MNKKHKILFSLCAVFMFAFSMLMVNLQPLFVKADTLDTTYNVSFVAPDNSILYSTGSYVPSGSSLNDIEDSNIFNNSYFSETFSFPVNPTYGWYISGSPSYTINSSIPYLTFNSATYTSTKFLIYDLDTSLYRGKTLTFSANINNHIYSLTWLVKSSGTGGSNAYQTEGGIALRFYIYNDTRLGVTFDITTSFSSSVNIYWAKVEESSSFTGYYNSDYISNKLSAYNFSNYYYQYDIDTSSAITSDKYYYPNKFSLQYDTWLPKVWSGLNNFNGNMVWSDGVNTYYSNGTHQYVLDVATSTWTQKTWNGFSNLVGYNIWTDGSNYYYSNDIDQYVLDFTSSTWSQMTWNGYSRFEGHSIWTDGINYYFSYNNEQFVLNQSTSTWSDKIWYGITNIFGSNVWTDGSNYYYSSSTNQYFLSVSTWAQKTWNGLNNFSGSNIWFNGINYCYSNGTQQYILNVSTWKEQIWNGLNNFDGSNVWSNSFGIYYSNGTQQYVLASSLTPVDSSYYYQNGYNDGYNTGYNNGYNSGYSIGEENSRNYTFFSLISSVIDAPIKTLTGLFNFEFLGINLWSFFTGLFTLALIILIIKLALGGK